MLPRGYALELQVAVSQTGPFRSVGRFSGTEREDIEVGLSGI